MVRKTGFSLVELVIVIVIIGIIAAIAVPRISRGAAGAAGSAVRADLTTLRSAIERYAAEHDGAYPSISPSTKFVDQLTTYSDDQGNTNDTLGAPYIYGPYLGSIPHLPVGEGANSGKGQNAVGSSPAAAKGWVYDEDTGRISANSGTATDGSGVLFSDY